MVVLLSTACIVAAGVALLASLLVGASGLLYMAIALTIISLALLRVGRDERTARSRQAEQHTVSGAVPVEAGDPAFPLEGVDAWSGQVIAGLPALSVVDLIEWRERELAGRRRHSVLAGIQEQLALRTADDEDPAVQSAESTERPDGPPVFLVKSANLIEVETSFETDPDQPRVKTFMGHRRSPIRIEG